LHWKKIEAWRDWAALSEGCYLLRSNVRDWNDDDLWKAYILVCFLAFVLWKTLAQRCRRAKLGHEPRRVFEELGKIQMVDVVLPTRDGTELRRRCITQPTDHQAILLARLGLNLPRTPLTDCL
jgi:hypothetical protein